MQSRFYIIRISIAGVNFSQQYFYRAGVGTNEIQHLMENVLLTFNVEFWSIAFVTAEFS